MRTICKKGTNYDRIVLLHTDGFPISEIVTKVCANEDEVRFAICWFFRYGRGVA